MNSPIGDHNPQGHRNLVHTKAQRTSTNSLFINTVYHIAKREIFKNSRPAYLQTECTTLLGDNYLQAQGYA